MLGDPGGRDRRIEIFLAGRIDDGTATVDGPLVRIGKRWARKADVSDAERMRASENGSSLTTRYVVRSDVLTRTIGGRHVIEYRGRRYDVVGVKEIGDRDDEIEISTTSRSDGA